MKIKVKCIVSIVVFFYEILDFLSGPQRLLVVSWSWEHLLIHCLSSLNILTPVRIFSNTISSLCSINWYTLLSSLVDFSVFYFIFLLIAQESPNVSFWASEHLTSGHCILRDKKALWIDFPSFFLLCRFLFTVLDLIAFAKGLSSKFPQCLLKNWWYLGLYSTFFLRHLV